MQATVQEWYTAKQGCVVPFPDQFHEDIGWMIAEHLDIVSLISFSHACKTTRIIAQTIFSNRIKAHLRLFLRNAGPSVLDMIFSRGGALYGSAIFHLLNSDATWSPDNLNIVVPFGCVREIANELLAQHFVELDGPDWKWPWVFVARPMRIFAPYCHPDESATDVMRPIVIVESLTSSVWPVILASNNTSQMDIVDATHVVSLHPHLSCHNMAFFHRLTDAENARHRGISVLSRFTGKWICERWCPAETKHLGKARFGLFEWRPRDAQATKNGSSNAKSPTAELAIRTNLKHKWRLAWLCPNKQCPGSWMRPSSRGGDVY
ncbi:hypothetical protein Hypma_014205 [Hypsizygus marmoreus]|uniref:F-box domain-containing protein n=1 Tax=Hypsizygus marmoreus TaxID=39966 RepID=A0A369JAQ3_HYPMA|nr:hypothetical protein Hypma_014205 [Hypsizygus marmoreus]